MDNRLFAGDLGLLAKTHGHAVDFLAQLVAGRRCLLFYVVSSGKHLHGIRVAVVIGGQRGHELGASRIREDLVLGAGKRVVGVAVLDLSVF